MESKPRFVFRGSSRVKCAKEPALRKAHNRLGVRPAEARVRSGISKGSFLLVARVRRVEAQVKSSRTFAGAAAAKAESSEKKCSRSRYRRASIRDRDCVL